VAGDGLRIAFIWQRSRTQCDAKYHTERESEGLEEGESVATRSSGPIGESETKERS